MQYEDTGKNSYFKSAEEKFLSSAKKLQDMEHDFKPSMIAEYQKERSAMSESLVDLVKFGVEYYIEGDDIVVDVDNNIIQASKSDVIDELGEDKFNQFFTEDFTEDTPAEKERKEKKKEPQDDDRQKQVDPYAILPQANAMNPWQALFSAMMMPFVNMMTQQNVPSQPQQNTGSNAGSAPEEDADILKDAKSLQSRIAYLDQSKKKTSEELKTYKDKCDELNRQIDKLSQDINESRDNCSALTETFEQEKKAVEDQRDALTATIDTLQKQYDAVVQEKTSICDSKKKQDEIIAGLQEQIKAKSAEKEALETKIGDMTKSFETEKKNWADKMEASEKLSTSLQHQLQEARDAVDKAKKELSEKESQYAKKISDIEEQKRNDIRKIEEQKRSDIAKAEDNLKAENAKAAEAVKTVESLRQEITKTAEAVRQQNAENEKKINSLNAQISDHLKKEEEKDNKISSVSQEYEKMSNDLAAAKRGCDAEKAKSERLEKDAKTIAEEKSRLKERCTVMEKEMEELKKLAYDDIKTRAANNNAFNRDFVKVNKDTALLAQVSISGMKIINLNYGRQAGDEAIKRVADELFTKFDKKNVYRVLGDQFLIIGSGECSDMQGKMNAVKQELSLVQINISFGIAIGSQCTNLNQMIKMAEEKCAQMKSGIFSNAYEDRPYVPDAECEKQFDEEEDEDVAKDKKPVVSSDEPETMDMAEALCNYLNSND